jgi:cysteine-S-conjugate beta-lyase
MCIPSPVLFALQKITEIAHSHGALGLVDNSIMSPVLSCPIELGAGMEKYIY